MRVFSLYHPEPVGTVDLRTKAEAALRFAAGPVSWVVTQKTVFSHVFTHQILAGRNRQKSEENH